jgi:hypothetical protein
MLAMGGKRDGLVERIPSASKQRPMRSLMPMGDRSGGLNEWRVPCVFTNSPLCFYKQWGWAEVAKMPMAQRPRRGCPATSVRNAPV